jgi:hypothetical protein
MLSRAPLLTLDAACLPAQARNAVRGADAARWCEAPRGEAWLEVRPEAAEHLITSGDVGRPAHVLATAFPEVVPCCFEHLAEPWWFCPADKPNCALRGLLQSSESKEQLKRRIGAFRKWVCARPEREMVIFGHSTFFKYFTNSGTRLKNCEVLTIRV